MQITVFVWTCAQHLLPQCLEAGHTTHAIMSLHAMRSEAHMLEKAVQKYNSELFKGTWLPCADNSGLFFSVVLWYLSPSGTGLYY